MSKVIAPLIFLCIAIGLFFTYIKPAYGTLAEWLALETKLNLALDNADNITLKLETLLTTYNDIPAADTARLAKLLPDSIDVVRLIIDVDKLAENSDVTISDFEIPRITRSQTTAPASAKPAPSELLGSAVLTLECKGTYEHFKTWLKSIEKNLVLLDVSGLEVDAASQDSSKGENGVNTYKVSLRTYWLK